MEGEALTTFNPVVELEHGFETNLKFGSIGLASILQLFSAPGLLIIFAVLKSGTESAAHVFDSCLNKEPWFDRYLGPLILAILIVEKEADTGECIHFLI